MSLQEVHADLRVKYVLKMKGFDEYVAEIQAVGLGRQPYVRSPLYNVMNMDGEWCLSLKAEDKPDLEYWEGLAPSDEYNVGRSSSKIRISAGVKAAFLAILDVVKVPEPSDTEKLEVSMYKEKLQSSANLKLRAEVEDLKSKMVQLNHENDRLMNQVAVLTAKVESLLINEVRPPSVIRSTVKTVNFDLEPVQVPYFDLTPKATDLAGNVIASSSSALSSLRDLNTAGSCPSMSSEDAKAVLIQLVNYVGPEVSAKMKAGFNDQNTSGWDEDRSFFTVLNEASPTNETLSMLLSQVDSLSRN